MDLYLHFFQVLDRVIFWDYLIMGLSNGVRVMINDMKEEGQERSYGINVVRNLGISELENL